LKILDEPRFVLGFWMQENPCDFPEQRIARLSNSLVLKELPHLETSGTLSS